MHTILQIVFWVSIVMGLYSAVVGAYLRGKIVVLKNDILRLQGQPRIDRTFAQEIIGLFWPFGAQILFSVLIILWFTSVTGSVTG